MKHYTQLTQEQRYDIYGLMKADKTQSEIAQELKVDASTISREIRRNKGERGYRPAQAHQKAKARQLSKVHPLICASTWSLVDALIKQDWSPEQASGRLSKE